MKQIPIIFVAIVCVISGCYRPSWYRANTTYAELRTESEWCKSQTNIGSTRSEMIEQYERCMQGKGYELKGKDQDSGEPTIRVEQKEGPPIVIDKRSKVYVGVYVRGGSTPPTMSTNPAYRYFHKKDCKHLWTVSTTEITAGKAIAIGKSMCPDCFR